MKFTLNLHYVITAVESVGGKVNFGTYSKWKELHSGDRIQYTVNCVTFTVHGKTNSIIYRSYDNEILLQGDVNMAKAYLDNEGFVEDDEWWDNEHPGWREAQEEN